MKRIGQPHGRLQVFVDDSNCVVLGDEAAPFWHTVTDVDRLMQDLSDAVAEVAGREQRKTPTRYWHDEAKRLKRAINDYFEAMRRGDATKAAFDLQDAAGVTTPRRRGTT